MSTEAEQVETEERQRRLTAAGFPADESGAWLALAPVERAGLEAMAAATSELLVRGRELAERLPGRGERSEAEAGAAVAIEEICDATRERFLREHVDALYAELTADGARPLRDEELTFAAAERVPGLSPSREQVAAELRLPLADKRGLEIAQGAFLAHVLASPTSGAHLVHTMLRPTEEALDRLDDFRRTGVADLGEVHLSRRGKAGVLELRNPRHLNAEDDTTLAKSECATDLILLDPEIEVGVLRGGVVEHPRYAGRRVFGAGLNLTRIYMGLIPYMFFVTRDLGYVNKIYRGLTGPEYRPGEPERNTEKLWIAGVETYAIGGACQLLHVVDHVVAERGAKLNLPARKEGIIPGVSNLRLPRSVGDRLARQAILSGLEFVAGEPTADLICDEVVMPGEVDAAVDARIAALTDSGLINAAANRRAIRVGAEPLDIFRQYMATFSREQALCHLSPALVANLERHWDARERRL